MKNLSNEELIEELIRVSGECAENWPDNEPEGTELRAYKAELLSRIDRGEKVEYAIMRDDLSSVLSDSNGWIIYDDKEIALTTAKNFCGIVKTKHEAEIILLRQRAEKAEQTLRDSEENLRKMKEVIKQLYSCKYEPDKMLCIYQRWVQDHGAKS